MSLFRKILSIALTVIAAAVLFAIGAIIVTNKKLPEGEEGYRAEVLTDTILSRVNERAWNRLRYVAWSYGGGHEYVWDKRYNLAEICFADNRVLLNLRTLEGRAWVGGLQLSGDEKRKILEKAWRFWCNDSFWLNPLVKLRDPGTERRIVMLDDRSDGLLVTYTEGGVTPGDSYLWSLNDDGMPEECRMWVKILPLKGLKVTWEEWTDIGGALIATKHRIGPVTIGIDNLRGGDHHSDLGLEVDPFTDF